jgi:biopolymer transport protein ExbB/TolQ
MDLDLVEMWGEMGMPVRGVVIVLTMQAIASIAVVIDRIALLARSRKRSAGFAAEASPLLSAGRYERALVVASKAAGSHLASFMHTGIKTFLDRLNAGDDREKAAERTRRALERKGETLSTSLNKGMGVLASTGSTAPFVGLLGTVLGIINAFHMMAESGQGGVAVIGAAIGEALVVTGYGLLVAIPTVLAFNWLSNKIAAYESGLVNAASELVDQLEADPIRPEGSPEPDAVELRGLGTATAVA